MKPSDSSPQREWLLAELRSDDAVDAAALKRVQDRVAATLTSAHLAALGQVAPPEPRSALPRRLWRGSRGLGASLIVGAALGAGGHALVIGYAKPPPSKPAAVPSSAPSVLAMTRKVSPPRPAPVREPGAMPTLDTPTTAEPKTRVTPVPSSGPNSGLAAELAALEAARRALASGEPTRALKLLAGHAERHPGSILAQERDALSIKSLVAAGRHGEARAAADRFSARYPNGLLLPAVEAALATIP